MEEIQDKLCTDNYQKTHPNSAQDKIDLQKLFILDVSGSVQDIIDRRVDIDHQIRHGLVHVLVNHQELNYIARVQKLVLRENHFDGIPFIINAAAAEKYVRTSNREPFPETAPAHNHIPSYQPLIKFKFPPKKPLK